MTDETPDPSPAAAPRSAQASGSRRPSTRVLAAAAGLVVAVSAVAVGLSTRDEDPGPVATASASPDPTATADPDAGRTPPATASPTSPPPTDPPATDPAAPPAPDAGAAADAPPDETVVPSQVVPELPPVPLDDVAEFGTSVSARLTSVQRVEGEGQGLGELSGPALAVTIEVENGTGEPVDLDFVVVNLEDAGGTPGQVLFGDPRSEPLQGSLPVGETRAGTYVLRLPAPDTTEVAITVSYGAEAPTAVFEGPVPA